MQLIITEVNRQATQLNPTTIRFDRFRKLGSYQVMRVYMRSRFSFQVSIAARRALKELVSVVTQGCFYVVPSYQGRMLSQGPVKRQQSLTPKTAGLCI
jgi:hypothetical protein